MSQPEFLFGVACGSKAANRGFPRSLLSRAATLEAILNCGRDHVRVGADRSALSLACAGLPWIQDYLHNAKGFVTANSIDDFFGANPSRFTLINLQVPFFSITGHSSSANLLAFAVGGLLLCVWLYWVVRQSGPTWAGTAASRGNRDHALLPVYHRFYDAALLIVPLCWCMSEIGMIALA